MTNTHIEEKVAVIKNQHDLIKGDFSTEDAKEVLNHLISKKINFHELKNFSNEVRNGEIDQFSKDRINDLLSTRDSINLLLAQAQESGKSIRIQSKISIELI